MNLSEKEIVILQQIKDYNSSKMPYSKLKKRYCAIFDDKSSNFKTITKRMEDNSLIVKIPNLLDMRKRFIMISEYGKRMLDNND